ncbi:hypothetical protein BH11PLA1_BH11PLA1_22060 [soil metagenome]
MQKGRGMLISTAGELFVNAIGTVTPGPVGEERVSKISLGDTGGGVQLLGAMQESLIARGRLVAPSMAALTAQVSAIAASITSPPTVLDLVDDVGRMWTYMGLTEFRTPEPVRMGRVASVRFEAVFLKFK